MKPTDRNTIVRRHLRGGSKTPAQLQEAADRIRRDLLAAGGKDDDIVACAADMLAITLDNEKLSDADCTAYITALKDGFGVDVASQEDEAGGVEIAVTIRRAN